MENDQSMSIVVHTGNQTREKNKRARNEEKVSSNDFHSTSSFVLSDTISITQLKSLSPPPPLSLTHTHTHTQRVCSLSVSVCLSVSLSICLSVCLSASRSLALCPFQPYVNMHLIYHSVIYSFIFLPTPTSPNPVFMCVFWLVLLLALIII